MWRTVGEDSQCYVYYWRGQPPGWYVAPELTGKEFFLYQDSHHSVPEEHGWMGWRRDFVVEMGVSMRAEGGQWRYVAEAESETSVDGQSGVVFFLMEGC